MLSTQAQSIIAAFRADFADLDEHRSQLERDSIYAAIVSHIRSSQPMALLGGGADVVEPLARETIVLGSGASVDLSVDDGITTMYVIEATGRDAAVPVTAAKAGELRAALARVR